MSGHLKLYVAGVPEQGPPQPDLAESDLAESDLAKPDPFAREAGDPARLSLRLLGAFELRVGGRPVPLPGSAQRLVALLALRGRCGRSRIAGELWPETTEHRAMGCLRTAIWRVNQVAPGLVSSSPGAAALGPEADVDVRRLVEASQGLLAGGAPSEVHRPAPQDAYLLPDWEDPWLTVDRERLRQLQLHVLEAHAERFLAMSAYGLALEWALAAVRAEPLRESAHRAVIRIHVAEGNQTEARRSFDQCVALFDRELGVRPGTLTTALLATAP